MIAPVAVAAAAVLVVTFTVIGRVSGDGRLDERRPAFSAQLPVFFYEHVHCQDAHHLSQHEGQSSEIKGPAVGVALLVVALTGVS